MSAQFDAREHEGVSYVRVTGVIDDAFDAKAFLEAIRGPRVILNLSRLERIDDAGKRVWRRTLEHLSDHHGELFVWDCPSELTEQFAETPALLAQAKVASYQVPYRCTSCRKDIAVRLDAATLNPDDVSGALCRGCDGKLRVQRNPEVLVDLRKHSAFDNAALRMKNLVSSMERRFDDPDFLQVHTASDLPDAFESTTSVLPAGQGETKIEELTPVHAESTVPAEEPPEATRPERPSELRDDRTVPDRAEPPAAAPSERRASNKAQVRLEPRPAGTAQAGGGWRPPTLEDIPPAPNPDAHLVGERQVRLRPRPSRMEQPAVLPLVGVGLAALLLGWLIGSFSADEGLPEQPVLAFTVSLNEGDFTRAEAVLEATEGELPSLLVDLYRQELARARADAADIYREQARQAFKEQRYGEAASYAQEALLIEDPQGRMLFLLAESLRLDERPNEAMPHYRAYFEKFPEDDWADDAMYWRAESLARLGQYDEAKDLLEQILALERTNFKRSAAKLLMDLP